jgi:hypothetical protein
VTALVDPLLSAQMARQAALDDKAAGQYARVNPDWLVALIDLATGRADVRRAALLEAAATAPAGEREALATLIKSRRFRTSRSEYAEGRNDGLTAAAELVAAADSLAVEAIRADVRRAALLEAAEHLRSTRHEAWHGGERRPSGWAAAAAEVEWLAGQ